MMDRKEKIKRRTEVTLRHLLKTPIEPLSNFLSHYNTCGIIGIVNKKESAVPYLLEGLTILQNRGYDSAGMCTIDNKKNDLIVSKYASLTTTSDAIVRLKSSSSKHEGHVIGIAHTRWATHGGKTDKNAHPHCDYKNRVALIHNGVIENSSELREKLLKKGIVFKSETDTEVIVQLIGYYLDNGKTLIESIKCTLNELEGTWGLAIISKLMPDTIICCRNGSPLLIGICEGKMFVASESAAFSRHTKNMISLENGEIAIITSDGVKELIGKRKSIEERMEQAQDSEVKLSPSPYPHWTLKEINEQPMSLARALNFGGRIADSSNVKLGGLEQNKEWLLKIKHLIIAACGTSYYSGLYGAKLMRQLKSFETIQVIDAAELDSDDFPTKNAGLLVISQSGETADVLRCLNLAEKKQIPCFSVVNKVGSLIARTTSCGVYVNAGREHAVASTKAFTSQVTILCLIAIWFSQNKNVSELVQLRKHIITSLLKLPTCVGMMLNNLRNLCKKISSHLIKHHTIFILGKGYGEPIAREGSLKIKEITYTHAEAYASGALKHGPFALIENGTPIIILILDDQYYNLNVTALHEVRARGAYTIVITDKPDKVKNVANQIIEIPSNGVLTALLGVLPLQLIAYEMSILKNIGKLFLKTNFLKDPDKPRNLAKSVTVL